MTIKLSFPEVSELKPRITVFGVGGAGGNAVNNMITAGLEGVEFVVGNTDAQALSHSTADRRIQMGATITEGLGAGSRPEIGCAAAEESLADIQSALQGAHMVFVTAGMGGGTGTGAAPVVARAAREQNLLTIGVVTKPFQFEGKRRLDIAEAGITEIHKYVDTLIIIPNQNLFRIATEKTTFADAFAKADDVLHSGVAGITDLMVRPGLINLDFADVRSVMNEMGKAMMGTGEASGEKRATEAAEMAISNPLLDDVSMRGACGLLINITGSRDMTLYEVDEAANRIREEVDPAANIIIGSTFDDNLDGAMRISVVATGIAAEEMQTETAPPRRPVAPVPLRPAGTPSISLVSPDTPRISGYPSPVVASGAATPPPPPPPPPIITTGGATGIARQHSPVAEGSPMTMEAHREADTPATPPEQKHEEETVAGAGNPAAEVVIPEAHACAADISDPPATGVETKVEPVPEDGAISDEEPLSPVHMLSQQPARRKWGLLERLTDARRGWQRPSPGGAEAESVTRPKPEPALTERKSGETVRSSFPATPVARTLTGEDKGRRHPGMEPGLPPSFDHPGLDEEQLEIPAFLRRQVN